MGALNADCFTGSATCERGLVPKWGWFRGLLSPNYHLGERGQGGEAKNSQEKIQSSARELTSLSAPVPFLAKSTTVITDR